MNQHVFKQIEALKTMNGTQLKAAYIEVFDERPHSHRHDWLRGRIAWGIQAKAERGMSHRFIEHGLEHADLSELRVSAPRSTTQPPRTESQPKAVPSIECSERDPRIPPPGSVLERDFQGRRISITVLAHGFEWNGQVFASFTKALKTAIGKSYSPFAFFKLGKKPKG